MSGLSLRTIQRLDAGHRVSYASLRALAVTFQVDVDLLEREYYAVNKTMQVNNSVDEFIEIPRWVRFLDDARWFGCSGPSRKSALLVEAILLGLAAALFIASFLVAARTTHALRAFAVVELLCGYFVSRYIRLSDKYQLWYGSEGARPQPPLHPRTWRMRTAQYAYLLGMGMLSIVLICWFAF